MRYHCDFIKQAIDMLDEIYQTNDEVHKGFVWQCENFWQVENFYESADEAYKKKFEHYVLSWEIGLSGNYLNLTELVTGLVLRVKLYLEAEDNDGLACTMHTELMDEDLLDFDLSVSDERDIQR